MIIFITILFKKHKKHLPSCLKNTFIGSFLSYGFMILLSAWILQGIRIMNWRESILKIGFTCLFTIMFICLNVPFFLSFVIAHTLNFALNGQLFAMYTHMGATGVRAEKFLKDTIRLSKMIEKKKFIRASIAYGSLSRGCYKRTSDIDIRLIPAKGGWWATAFYAVWLRTWAFFAHYPLDMYCYDPEVVIKKMRSDELPIMVNERNKCMMPWYPERVEFDEFVKIFTNTNIKRNDTTI